eukprot:1179008-Prorocentrum_minimum.AAC.1
MNKNERQKGARADSTRGSLVSIHRALELYVSITTVRPEADNGSCGPTNQTRVSKSVEKYLLRVAGSRQKFRQHGDVRERHPPGATSLAQLRQARPQPPSDLGARGDRVVQVGAREQARLHEGRAAHFGHFAVPHHRVQYVHTRHPRKRLVHLRRAPATVGSPPPRRSCGAGGFRLRCRSIFFFFRDELGRGGRRSALRLCSRIRDARRGHAATRYRRLDIED